MKVAFNYESIEDAKARSQAKQQAEQINKLLRASAVAIVDVGKRLIAVRERMGSKMFRAWIECEFSWQQPTAANYMQAARAFGDLDCLDKFQPSALTQLARANIPESTVNEMIDQARSGKVVTYKTVRDAIAKNPNFVPARSDAKTPRRSEPDRSIATTQDMEVKSSVEWLRDSINLLAERVPMLTLKASDRDALANRIMELAFQLRSLVCLPEPKTPRIGQATNEEPSPSKPRSTPKRTARELVTA
jgi:hypothetical protein